MILTSWFHRSCRGLKPCGGVSRSDAVAADADDDRWTTPRSAPSRTRSMSASSRSMSGRLQSTGPENAFGWTAKLEIPRDWNGRCPAGWKLVCSPRIQAVPEDAHTAQRAEVKTAVGAMRTPLQAKWSPFWRVTSTNAAYGRCALVTAVPFWIGWLVRS